eukprot:COSAG05_NODE_1037_length_6076_cov_6.031621_3_plen_42_part_00
MHIYIALDDPVIPAKVLDLALQLYDGLCARVSPRYSNHRKF